MRIALVDVDGHSGFPHYDRVYLSKVFTFTQDFDTVIDADEIITGGTGYKDYTSLPPDGGEPPNEQKAFARWVNVHSVHNSCT